MGKTSGIEPAAMFAPRIIQWLMPVSVFAVLVAATVMLRWPHTSLAVITVQVGGLPLVVEVADNATARSRGLQHRDKLAADAGMLFVYPDAGVRRFWMKDTQIDLDIGFFDDASRLIEVRSMTALDQHVQHVSSKPAKYALEVNRGWFAANRVAAGAVLRLQPPADTE